MRSLFCAAILLLGLSLTLAPATAFADDDAPYSPRNFSVDELIVTDRFDAPPLAFPWQPISSDRQANRGRMDFEMVFDIDYDTFAKTVDEARQKNEELLRLEPEAMRYVDHEGLLIMGIQPGQTSSRLAVGHPDLQTQFIVEFEADGPRTRVLIHNTVRTRQFSGFVPARVDFLPQGADAVPFRWN